MKKKITNRYAWSIGTTTFRQSNLSTKLELALQALNNTRELKPKAKWPTLYSTFMSELTKFNIINNHTKYTDKDARAITSSLQQIGLCTMDRQVTNSGTVLLDITNNSRDMTNVFNLSPFSYFYFLQLFKKREFLFCMYILINVDNRVNIDEFTTFVMTLAPDSDLEEIENVIQTIIHYRSLETELEKTAYKDSYIFNKLMINNKLKKAHNDFVIQNRIKIKDLDKIFLNRKGNSYNQPLKELYILLLGIKKNNQSPNFDVMNRLLNSSDNLKKWKKIIFSDVTTTKEKNAYFLNTFIPDIKSRSDKNFREWFFSNFHLIKAKALLEIDYFDLNKRMFSMTGVIKFEQNQITVTPFLKIVLLLNKKNIKQILNDKLNSDIEEFQLFEELYNSSLELDLDKVYAGLSEEFQTDVNKTNINDILINYQNDIFEQFIETNFDEIHLVKIFKKIVDQYSTSSTVIAKNTADQIRRLCKIKDADTPTIFEYLTAISWYYISEKNIRPLESLNLELNADNLPISHASGGQADLLIKYEDFDDIKDHNLMIEVTLTKDSNQRRAEMEPVSRHLGEYKIKNKNTDTYCVFLTHKLDTNTIVHFRQQKITPYYYNKEWTEGSKIIPLDINNLNYILENKVTYSRLYNLFEEAYNSDTDVKNWWEEDINKKITSLK
ncbi:hypothetical protein CBF34_10365 [Vagococcus penaei]|uniref:Uncharacterized protein n=1 Tax=Vagococcus penaei TaxID=633807 RepID=A0A1Q2D5X1_9ENTE|nr:MULTISPECIES: AlwI family type II restriction endonuclease [Vagococcus]AQP53820.1 hypothetical protein BW732_05925 [Vagococcus penaei]MBO0436214.1 AlwI family type II restriction endonuclease [Vagococcus fluvialis]RST98350.1 hypothetical protein CBF34_10365 [Vagococcus penaei]